jgi:uncharacterized protein YkwD
MQNEADKLTLSGAKLNPSCNYKKKAKDPSPEEYAGVFYSHGEPTAFEQQMLEYINQARLNPRAEGMRLSDSKEFDVINSLNFFQINRKRLKEDFSFYIPKPPLAFNKNLIQSARKHSLDMSKNGFQGHIGSDGTSSGNRMRKAGYILNGSWSLGENVYAYAKSIIHAHSAFNVDWGCPVLAHRKNIMEFDKNNNKSFREIGIGIVDGNGKVGPLVMTENFASSADNFFLLGVVYNDINKNYFYDIDEGIKGVTIATSQGTYYTITSESGGYAIPLTSIKGNMRVMAIGNGIKQTKTIKLDRNNIKVDFYK